MEQETIYPVRLLGVNPLATEVVVLRARLSFVHTMRSSPSTAN